MKMATGTTNDCGIIFYAQGADDFFRFTLRAETGWVRITRLLDRGTGGTYELATVLKDIALETGEWHELKVALDDDYVRAFVDDIPVAEACGLPVTHGCIGLSADRSVVRYDNICVSPTGVVERDVQIDIKPGSFPNSINLKSKGVVPMAMLGTNDFAVSDVDHDTVMFANAVPLRWALEDVDNDGDEDMILHFKTQELTLDAASTEATLTGTTTDGVSFVGTDSVA